MYVYMYIWYRVSSNRTNAVTIKVYSYIILELFCYSSTNTLILTLQSKDVLKKNMRDEYLIIGVLEYFVLE